MERNKFKSADYPDEIRATTISLGRWGRRRLTQIENLNTKISTDCTKIGHRHTRTKKELQIIHPQITQIYAD
jgi:hypothetical protein